MFSFSSMGTSLSRASVLAHAASRGEGCLRPSRWLEKVPACFAVRGETKDGSSQDIRGQRHCASFGLKISSAFVRSRYGCAN